MRSVKIDCRGAASLCFILLNHWLLARYLRKIICKTLGKRNNLKVDVRFTFISISQNEDSTLNKSFIY